jgi:hypothetical protein
VWLSANDPDVPWDRVADTLLDRSLEALRAALRADVVPKYEREGPGSGSQH